MLLVYRKNTRGTTSILYITIAAIEGYTSRKHFPTHLTASSNLRDVDGALDDPRSSPEGLSPATTRRARLEAPATRKLLDSAVSVGGEG